MKQSSGNNTKVNKKIINIYLIILLIVTMVLITGCESNKNEIKTEENIPVTENITSEEKVKGIEVGENLLKYGTYEGIDLAKDSKITLNEDGTFLYEDNEISGEGTYEVKNQEINDIEGNYNAWVIEFNSLDKASNGKIPEDFYWLFTETGDISQEEASINFNYKE